MGKLIGKNGMYIGLAIAAYLLLKHGKVTTGTTDTTVGGSLGNPYFTDGTS